MPYGIINKTPIGKSVIDLSTLSDKYNSSNVYMKGDYCIRANKIWKCLADNTTGSWDASKWQATSISSEIQDIYTLKKPNYPRQKDLTNEYTKGNFDEWVKNGLWNYIQPGDYIIGPKTGKKCWIAHRDAWYGAYYIGFETTHHVLLWYADALGSGPMNDSNTTAGGYSASKGKATVKTLIANNFVADFGSHIKTFQNLLTTAVDGARYNRYGQASGASSNWAWEASQGDLPSEVNLYGSIVWSSSGYDTGIQNFLFEIIRDMGINEVLGAHNVWLKDVVSGTRFAFRHYGGDSYPNGASDSDEFRPFSPYAAA